MRVPVIDLGDCTDCGGCIEVCPLVFRKNPGTDLMEVVDLADYPDTEVDEAIKLCPADCIGWEEG